MSKSHAAAIETASEAAHRPEGEREAHRARVFGVMWEAAGEAERERYVERAKRLLGGGK